MPSLLAINLEIGLGHPYYLDYVLQAIKIQNPRIPIKYLEVLSREKGLAQYFWRFSEKLYCFGAQGGLSTKFYNKFRASGKGHKLARFCLMNIKKEIADKHQVVLVSHPILAHNLNGDIWYIHGEIAAPPECACNVKKIVVPTEATKQKLINYGVKSDTVFVSGLVICPDLVISAEENFKTRLLRLNSDKPLTVGFFISGAYPKPHIQKIIEGIISVTKDNFRTIVFTGINQKKTRNFIAQLNQKQNLIFRPKSSIVFIQSKHRVDYQKRVTRLLPLLDIFVSASHEHTNWAVGLGIPMFVLFPMIGSYAIENYQFAKEQGVVYPISTIAEARNLAKVIKELHKSGILAQMAVRGWGKLPINGAYNTAQELIKILN
ncbi:MAG: hypothetical protein N2201_01925 [candidate division WOR-3 bacterium]|nr:hypothetical protein [candidate division WOR-3 bacterium]